MSGYAANAGPMLGLHWWGTVCHLGLAEAFFFRLPRIVFLFVFLSLWLPSLWKRVREREQELVSPSPILLPCFIFSRNAAGPVLREPQGTHDEERLLLERIENDLLCILWRVRAIQRSRLLLRRVGERAGNGGHVDAWELLEVAETRDLACPDVVDKACAFYKPKLAPSFCSQCC